MDFLIFVIVLSILVLVHELGHFWAAKRYGIKVVEFGFGIPPRLFGKQIGETLYSINWLPFGGFVRLYGENEAEFLETELNYGQREKLKKSAFFSQTKKVRVLVLTAGVMMNLLLGIIVFSGLYTAIGIPTPLDKVEIIGIAAGSPAEKAFELGDEVVAIMGEAVENTQKFKQLVDERLGDEVRIQLKRSQEMIEVTVVPRYDHPETEGSLGVVIAPKIEYKHYPVWQMPIKGMVFGLQEAYGWGMTITTEMGKMFLKIFRGNFPQDVGGPVEIYFLVSEVAAAGLAPLLQLVGVLSINLAVINLFPIPGFDGGYLLFVLIETVSKKKVNKKVERVVTAIGFAFLLALMLTITVRDIARRLPFDKLLDSFFMKMENL